VSELENLSQVSELENVWWQASELENLS